MSGSARDHALALEAQRQTERIYAEWRARRDQLQSEYEGEVKHEEYTTRKAIAAVEAEFHRNMQVATANGPQTVAMVEEVMATKKDLKIKELENRLRDTRSKVQAHYEKQLLEHTTKFSDAIMAKMGPLAMYTAVSETMLDRSRRPWKSLILTTSEAATCLVSNSPSSLARGTDKYTSLFRPTIRQQH
jgi:glutathione synthase/RimK-type ligase-like ATP-grasp enzyme